MSNFGRLIRALLATMLWLAIAVSATKITHDFYRYIDRSIHVTVDDGEANISYALATEGRYGFMSSPVLVGMDRTRAQFNYGPWYFYLGAALTWLFGFSVTLLRSIHLWGILSFVALGAWWFGGRHRVVAAAMFAFALLYCFEASHWPMVRPDILVSAFALMFVIGAGLGWSEGRSRYWFVAGLGATCGAFTHLIAASLIPSAFAVLALALLAEHRASLMTRPAWLKARSHLLALAGGIALGLVMFYGSFGFDFATQRRFFSAYREATAAQTVFTEVIAKHLGVAFGYLSVPARWGVFGLWIAAWLSAIGAMWMAPDRRRLVHSRLVPSLVVWTAFTVSNGFYSNYHQGYAILHQVMFLWTAAAAVWLILELIERRSARAGAVIGALAMMLVLVQANWMLRWQFSDTSWKVIRTATWAPFSEYSERVLQSIPVRSTAWGSIVFGMEAPGRIQLVQWADAVAIFPRVPAAEREALTPDYIIFGYAEARDNMMSALRGGETLLDRTLVRLPGAQYRLTSLVAAVPYGVTRIYARTVAPSAGRDLPLVSAYDSEHREWLNRIGAPLAATFTPTTPISLRIGYEAEPPAAAPANSLTGDLPAGRYLLKVRVKPGQGRSPRRLIAATSAGMVRQTIGEMGPDGDFGAYLENDADVILLLAHQGGPVYVSQFDDGADPKIEGVEVRPIFGLLDPDEQPSRWTTLAPFDKWKTAPGVVARADGESVQVDGDASAFGYQFSSPPVRVGRKNRVTVRMPVRVDQGRVCAGVLKGDDSGWLVHPDASRESLQFTIDATQGFRVVLANCKSGEDATASRFMVWPGSYRVDPIGEFYADRLVTAALYPNAPKQGELAGLDVLTLPSGLEVTKAEADSAVANFSPADLSFRAGIVRQEGNSWIAQGNADGPFSYLMQSNPVRMNGRSRVLISGRVERGGVTIGLQRNNQWVSQLNVTEPGDFTIVMAPPSGGTYSVLVANNLSAPGDLNTSITFTRIGMLKP